MIGRFHHVPIVFIVSIIHDDGFMINLISHDDDQILRTLTPVILFHHHYYM